MHRRIASPSIAFRVAIAATGPWFTACTVANVPQESDSSAASTNGSDGAANDDDGEATRGSVTDGGDAGTAGNGSETGPGPSGTSDGSESAGADDGSESEGASGEGADDTSGSEGSDSGGVSSGGPGDPACRDAFSGECGVCLAAACCAEVDTCVSDATCYDCATGAEDQCGDVAGLDELFECATAECADPCELSGSTTGIGETVAQCQGTVVSAGEIAGAEPSFQSGFAGSQQGALNMWIYTRASVEEVNFTGDDGEWQIRVLLTADLGGNEYAATAVAATWDAESDAWSTVASDDAAVVVVDVFEGVDYEPGMMCNGHVAGQLQAVFTLPELFLANFDLPLLTTEFPSAV